ncbi:MAG TPA: isoprenylcysteine carboxylmethyltransferase family protein [Bradyrhizobium sp.]|nr:isoprenylcysteine carboxylmethyltransferase family protein [Bradyrhizobium sp.]HET7886624.1 isoprenylcysteine carboxylmethyltransferase family protein [Bradyrhizobium sp.]
MPENPIAAVMGSGWTASWPSASLAAIWLAWLLSWLIGAFFSGRTEKHVRAWDARGFHIPIVIGAILLMPWTASALAERPLWRVGTSGIYVLAVLTAAGCLFTWWARLHLGRFWSNAITRKEGHRVVDTGPYGLVRHPIYTGLIGALIATGIAGGTATALLGVASIAFGFWQKARMEEGFLTNELGADAYGLYCRRVPMLVPFLPQG